jgi:protein-tyrosine phosphatase
MKHVYWVVPGKLGGRKGSNQEPWNLQEFRDQGVQWIISLSERMLNRSVEVVAYGLRHLCIPLPKNAPPQPGDAEDIYYILPLIESFITKHLSDGKIVVHCSSGKDRTALVLAYFLMVNDKLTPADAITTIQAVLPVSFTAQGWREMAESILNRYVEDAKR